MSCMWLLLDLIPFNVIVTHSSYLSTIKYDFFLVMRRLLSLLTVIIVDFELNWMFLSEHPIDSLSEVV